MQNYFCLKGKGLLSIFCAFLLQASLFAQESLPQDTPQEEWQLSLEALYDLRIQSTSFFSELSYVIPGYTKVIDLTDSKDNDRTLHDLLHRNVVGNSSGYFARFGSYHAVRGIGADNNGKTVFSLDGLDLSPRMHFGYSTGLTSPLLGDLQRVEVTNGPGAITLGSGAINGFVNLIPKNGTDNRGLQAKVQTGFKEKLAMAEVGYGFSYGKGRDIYVYGGVYEAEGFVAENYYGLEKNSLYDPITLGTGNPSFKTSLFMNHDGFKLNTTFFSDSPTKGNNFGKFNQFGDFQTTTLAVNPSYQHQFNEEQSLDINAGIILTDVTESYLKRGPRISEKGEEPKVFADTTERESGGSELHNQIKLIYKNSVFEDHKIAIGTRLGQKDFREKDLYFRKDSVFSRAEFATTKWDEFALFGEDIWNFAEHWNLIVGLRYDHYLTSEITSKTMKEEKYPPQGQSHLSPRLGLTWEISNQQIIKLSYRNGFRMPEAAYYNWNLYFNRYADSLGYGRTAELKPESMDNYEINYDYKLTDDLMIQANAFYNLYQNQLSYVDKANMSKNSHWTEEEIDEISEASGQAFGPSFTLNLAEEEVAFGGEIEVNWEVYKDIIITPSYAYALVGDELRQGGPVQKVVLNTQIGLFDNMLRLQSNVVHMPYEGILTSFGEELRDDVYKENSTEWNVSLSFQYTGAGILLGVDNALENEVPPITFNSAMSEQVKPLNERRIYLEVSYTGF